ncbi:TRAP transporter 4TM/12TM fusion protein [Lysinibacillus composti]|uniref:TRAP transporter permease n=1 Tax=Lysinibacillus composti TaxID=720633 RepID=A0A3N9URB9_9BACI|nr:TRAP transporter permease [Lysinibacillus composti]MBM7608866.1 TRAP transporter 4TM/12TM fusion protein [Lysinibacillus composti]RQW74446.1 TRAP transporter permease [Lysinibacillus composti]
MSELKSADLEIQENSSSKKILIGINLKLFTLIAVIMSLFHLFVLGFYPITPWILYTVHLGLGAILILMQYPMKKSAYNSPITTMIDYILILLVVFAGSYLILEMDELVYRIGVAPTGLDLVVSIILIGVVLEITRRTTGLILPILALLFILYAHFGKYIPGDLGHRGYSWDRILSYLNSMDAIFSVPIGASATFVFLFILFGSFLSETGGSKFFIDFAIGATGGKRGGPAKAAVVSSALFGSVSGNSVANVVSTGVFTIPLMKKIGYSSRYAGAVESVASTGGQIMPPILGSAAFIMAQLLGTSYINIVYASIVPALLYFFTVIIMIDLQAAKLGLKGLPKSELPNLKNVLLKEGHLFIPLLVLIFTMTVLNTSPIKAAIWAIASTILVSFVKKHTRMTFAKLISCLVDGAKSALGMIAACATAGLVIGVLNLTGAGLKFASLILSLAGDNLALALIMTMCATIILGMGLPTTAAYLITAAVVAPALIQMGVSPLAAHMFVFYFACLSAFTPPVALAAYAAAGIAEAKPMQVAMTSMKIGIVAFIIPFVFVYGPAILLQGTPIEIIVSTLTAIVGAFVLACGVEGWFIGKNANILVRILLITASLSLIVPGLITDAIGLGLIFVGALLQMFFSSKKLDQQNISEIEG